MLLHLQNISLNTLEYVQIFQDKMGSYLTTGNFQVPVLHPVALEAPGFCYTATS